MTYIYCMAADSIRPYIEVRMSIKVIGENVNHIYIYMCVCVFLFVYLTSSSPVGACVIVSIQSI